MINIELVPRNCDVCDSSEVLELWKYQYIAKTRSDQFIFKVRHVICQKCGFAFVTPVPKQSSLNAYYVDALSKYSGQPPTSSVDRRLNVLRKYAGNNDRLLEIGSNQLIFAHEQLREIFSLVQAVEPNLEVTSGYNYIEEVPDQSFEMIAHYYVLEHVQEVKTFLNNCHRILTPEGLMVCEVPDVHYYQWDASELLWWEHISHFSILTLQALASSCGFELIDWGYRHSSNARGFVAVFRKTSVSFGIHGNVPGYHNFLSTRSSFIKGLELVKNFEDRLSIVRDMIINAAGKGKHVTLWGVNDVMRRLISMPGFLPFNCIIVDDDLRKENYLDGCKVYHPDAVVDHVRNSQLLVLCSRRLKGVLLDRVKSISGKVFEEHEVETIDYHVEAA